MTILQRVTTNNTNRTNQRNQKQFTTEIKEINPTLLELEWFGIQFPTLFSSFDFFREFRVFRGVTLSDLFV